MAKRTSQGPEEIRRPKLLMPRAEAHRRIQKQIDAGRELLARPPHSREELAALRTAEKKWSDYNGELMRQLADTDDLVSDYYPKFGRMHFGDISFGEEVEGVHESISGAIGRLESIQGRLELIPEAQIAAPAPQAKDDLSAGLLRLRRLCERFHLLSRQLRDRHAGRPSFEIEDEYDVQDLLRAVLAIDFEDIRSEEWTPSYAGGAARMDFLIKPLGIVL